MMFAAGCKHIAVCAECALNLDDRLLTRPPATRGCFNSGKQAKYVCRVLDVNVCSLYLWTVSTVALSWKSRWKDFVSNLVLLFKKLII